MSERLTGSTLQNWADKQTCPKCKTPLNDEMVKRCYVLVTQSGYCPECGNLWCVQHTDSGPVVIILPRNKEQSDVT